MRDLAATIEPASRSVTTILLAMSLRVTLSSGIACNGLNAGPDSRYRVKACSVFGVTFFPPGAKHDIHRHPNAEEVEYLMSGSGIAYVGDDAVELGPGEAVFVPQNEYHGFENTSDGEVVMAWYYAGAASLDDAGFVTRSEDEGGEGPAG